MRVGQVGSSTAPASACIYTEVSSWDVEVVRQQLKKSASLLLQDMVVQCIILVALFKLHHILLSNGLMLEQLTNVLVVYFLQRVRTWPSLKTGDLTWIQLLVNIFPASFLRPNSLTAVPCSLTFERKRYFLTPSLLIFQSQTIAALEPLQLQRFFDRRGFGLF